MFSKIFSAVLVALAAISVVSCASIEPGRYIIRNRGEVRGTLRASRLGGYLFSSIFPVIPTLEQWDVKPGDKPNTYKFRNVALGGYVYESEGSLITDQKPTEYTIGGSKDNGYIVYSPIGFQTVWTINPGSAPESRLDLKPNYNFPSQSWDFLRIGGDFYPTVASAKFNAYVNDQAQKEVCIYI